ncbi:MAG: hypothetical protein ACREOK_15215 [Gemmatimonadaceae bacterium]
MRRVLTAAFPPILMLALATACQEAPPTPTAASALDLRASINGSEWSAWSAPVKLGPPISTPSVTDGNASLSPDGLSLYYDSDRSDLPGAQGARDIWVSRRACTNALDAGCAWQTPVNLGSVINSPYVDGFPSISIDGHLLFFVSHKTRPDCPAEPDEVDPTRPCDLDIYVSWRADPNDDRGWSPPTPLPPGINTSDEEGGPWLTAVGEPGDGNFYFNLNVATIRVTARGASAGPAVEVVGPIVALHELDHPTASDGAVTTSVDGRELFFMSSVERPGRGALDIWTSTRRNPGAPWSPPTNVTELNSMRADLAPRLSRDGTTMLLTTNRGDLNAPACRAAGLEGSCGWDIYIATRSRP